MAGITGKSAILRPTSPIVLANPKTDGANLTKLPRNPPADAPLSREGRQVRERTAPLARERRNPRSESTVFYRLLSGRIAPFAGPSVLEARIFDSVAESGVPGRRRNCAR